MTRKRYPTKAQVEKLQVLDVAMVNQIASMVFLCCGNAVKQLLVFHAPDMNEPARDKFAQQMIMDAVKLYQAEIEAENRKVDNATEPA